MRAGSFPRRTSYRHWGSKKSSNVRRLRALRPCLPASSAGGGDGGVGGELIGDGVSSGSGPCCAVARRCSAPGWLSTKHLSRAMSAALPSTATPLSSRPTRNHRGSMSLCLGAQTVMGPGIEHRICKLYVTYSTAVCKVVKSVDSVRHTTPTNPKCAKHVQNNGRKDRSRGPLTGLPLRSLSVTI